MTDADLADRARAYLDIQVEGLQALAPTLDASFIEAVSALAGAAKVLVCGIGKSWHVGRKIAATLNSTGTPAVALHAGEARHGDLGVAQAGDVALVLSFSGESDEIRDLTELLGATGLVTIALTRSVESWLGRRADLCLEVPVRREACPFNLAPTSSSLVTLALGDLLAVLASEARGFSREQFGNLHPAGAIGHSLRPVREVMRSGDRLATVNGEASLRDAVVAMTAARGGAVVVTDPSGQVCGVVTDGDVRRHLAENGELDAPVMEGMTRNPVTLRADRTVAEAWGVFRERAIDDLVVVEDDGTVAGLLDLQDLPKLKHF